MNFGIILVCSIGSVATYPSQPSSGDEGNKLTAGFVEVTNDGRINTLIFMSQQNNPSHESVSHPVMFKGRQSGRCLNIDGAYMRLNNPLHLYDCVPGAHSEQFHLVAAENMCFYLKAAHSGLCLGSKDDEDFAANNVVQTTRIGGNKHQMWWFEESNNGSEEYYIHQQSSDMVMNVAGGTTGNWAQIILWNKTAGAENELFIPVP